MAGDSDSGTSAAPAHQILIHVDESALTDGVGRSDLPVESVRRLICDANLVRIVENAGGEPLSVGRKQRTVPTVFRPH